MNAIVAFGAAFILSLAIIPFIRWYSLRIGAVDAPRKDRWQHAPVSRFGGIGLLVAFLVGVGIASSVGGLAYTQWGLLLCSLVIFSIGLYDDIRPVTPQAKMIAQILVAILAVLFGYSTDFFSPRIDNAIVAQLLNVLLTLIWLVGITNAINLLDNMDGLAGGIALITSGFLAYFFWNSADPSLLVICFALGGAVLGFLTFNFPPATIFMGDSGSLFLGFVLAVLAITRRPQASNVFAVLGVPTLLFLLPILDTVLVTFTRLLRGQSPVQGGRDHSSHRLIAFGLTERQSILALYGIAIVSGVAAAALESIQYWFSLVLVPLLVVALALLFAYLGGLKVIPAKPDQMAGSRITRIMLDLTFRWRVLEIILDSFLIGIAYYLAQLVGSGLRMDGIRMEEFLDSLPVVLAAAYFMFYLTGVYRGVWRYVGMSDLVRFVEAAVGSVVLTAAMTFIISSTDLAPWASSGSVTPLIYLILTIFLFLGLAASRSSFRILSLLSPRQNVKEETPVVIYGAGDRGILALNWLRLNPDLAYRPVGFLDDDLFLHGRWIHGIKVLGGLDDLSEILRHYALGGLILSKDSPSLDLEELVTICSAQGCWVRKVTVEFEQVGGDRHTI